MQQQFLDLKNIFTKDECDSLIKKYDANLRKLKVVAKEDSVYSSARSADGTWIRNPDPIVDRFKNLVAETTGLPIKNQEAPHFIKYENGGEYKLHFDFFNPKSDGYAEHISKGGQRIFSSILYLNENFEGGETDFPKLETRVKPVTGSVFFWRNVNLDGSLNENSIHAGLPVTTGVKYIIVIWVRESEFLANAPKSLPKYSLSNNKDKFEELGYTYISNIIDKEMCVDFAKEMFYLKFSNKLTAENRGQVAAANADPGVYKPSYGLGSIKKFDDYLKFISRDLSGKLGVSWKDKHTYTRIYYNGGLLGKHVDREGLDYTLSITLFSTLEKEWPLYCIDKKGNEVAVNTNIGDGLLILGTKMQHWRQPLICEPNQCIVQMFMHWSNP